MTTQQSAVALRNIIVGGLGYPTSSNPNDELATVNVSEYPDGALAYVLSTRATYRLFKTSTLAGQPGGAVVPAMGGGDWIQVDGGASNAFAAQVVGTIALAGSSSVAVTQNQWAALPSGATFYAEPSLNRAFTVNTTTGVVTYTGPTQEYVIICAAELSCATPAQNMELALTTNGALVGQVTFDNTAGGASSDPTTASLGESITTLKLVTLNNNDTFQAVMRNTTATPGNLSATHLNIVVRPS